jgi:sortase A
VRAIGLIGKVFISAGLVLLMFTVYLLWGTGLVTAAEQDRLEQELAAGPLVGADLEEGDEIPDLRPDRVPDLGDGLFRLKIPKIAHDSVVVYGVGLEELKTGVGMFPDCDSVSGTCVRDARWPGEGGNVSLSGHRTTYGSPFWRLDELEAGDTIDVVAGRVRHRYQVRDKQIVDPVGGFDVVRQHGRDELTLTTCHPRFSAAQRLIVHADYMGASLAATPGGPTGPPPDPAQPVVGLDVLILAGVALASALASMGLTDRFRKPAIYLAVGIGCAAGLWVGVFPRLTHLIDDGGALQEQAAAAFDAIIGTHQLQQVLASGWASYVS